jgi:hypothetical protein
MAVLSQSGRLVLLVACLLLAGCVPIGRRSPDPFVRALVMHEDSSIPLVPLPPPPLGQSDASPATPAPQRPGPVEAIPVSRNIPESAPGSTLLKPPAPATQPSDTPAWNRAGATVEQIHQVSAARLAQIDSYIARLVRREVVNGSRGPEELILFKFRRSPWSVYFKWLGKEGAGREVTYVRGQYDNKIHSLLAAGDIPFVPAGRRMALAPDNILVRSACRHPIEEAGFASSLEHIRRAAEAARRNDPRGGTLRVLGPLNRAEFDRPVLAIEHRLPAGLDPSLPRGGIRQYFFHPTEGLPTLVIAYDERNQEVEYYCYDRIQAGVRLDDADFDPDRLWGKPAQLDASAR